MVSEPHLMYVHTVKMLSRIFKLGKVLFRGFSDFLILFDFNRQYQQRLVKPNKKVWAEPAAHAMFAFEPGKLNVVKTGGSVLNPGRDKR